jgi:BlaI family transcriptional regulator, penicillinase repressor
MHARKIAAKSKRPPLASLSRRERQIMDIIYRLGRATAAEVLPELPSEPTYSTVRAQLRVLEEKGHVRHEEQGQRYIYTPTVPRHAMRQSALKHLVNTFFGGSREKVVSALLGADSASVSDEELERISQIIEKAKKERQ